MASPDAVRSPWVDREVMWWRENKSLQRLLVVLTEGEFAWDDTGDRASVALPPALHGAFVEEPRWVDLRWLRHVDQADQSNPRLRECVADITAAVREVPKDELIGEHIRQHRRTMKLARGGATALVVLLIAATVAAVVAVIQRNQAIEARHTVIARSMVAEADRIRDRNPRGALQVGIAANYIDPNPPTLASLTQTLVSSPYRSTLIGHTSSVDTVSFSPDGRTLATASLDGTVILWDLTDRNQPRRLGKPLTEHKYSVDVLAFSPDGRTLATAGQDRGVILWDLTERTRPRLLAGFTDYTNFVNAVAFSPDGRTLAIGSSERTVKLWDLTDRTQPRLLGEPLAGHTGWISSVAFSPDGHTLATASSDQTVKLWDLTDRTQPRPLGEPLASHTGSVDAVTFSPDGRVLATASRDQTIVLWDLTTLEKLRRNVLREACTRAGGPLNEARWGFYAPGLSYQDTCAGH